MKGVHQLFTLSEPALHQIIYIILASWGPALPEKNLMRLSHPTGHFL